VVDSSLDLDRDFRLRSYKQEDIWISQSIQWRKGSDGMLAFTGHPLVDVRLATITAVVAISRPPQAAAQRRGRSTPVQGGRGAGSSWGARRGVMEPLVGRETSESDAFGFNLTRGMVC
jgi:hypothetical protein